MNMKMDKETKKGNLCYLRIFDWFMFHLDDS